MASRNSVGDNSAVLKKVLAPHYDALIQFFGNIIKEYNENPAETMILAMPRKGYALFIAFLQAKTLECATSDFNFITCAHLFGLGREMFKKKNRHYPTKVIVMDDIILYGRSIERVIEKIRKYDDKDNKVEISVRVFAANSRQSVKSKFENAADKTRWNAHVGFWPEYDIRPLAAKFLRAIHAVGVPYTSNMASIKTDLKGGEAFCKGAEKYELPGDIFDGEYISKVCCGTRLVGENEADYSGYKAYFRNEVLVLGHISMHSATDADCDAAIAHFPEAWRQLFADIGDANVADKRLQTYMLLGYVNSYRMLAGRAQEEGIEYKQFELPLFYGDDYRGKDGNEVTFREWVERDAELVLGGAGEGLDAEAENNKIDGVIKKYFGGPEGAKRASGQPLLVSVVDILGICAVEELSESLDSAQRNPMPSLGHFARAVNKATGRGEDNVYRAVLEASDAGVCVTVSRMAEDGTIKTCLSLGERSLAAIVQISPGFGWFLCAIQRDAGWSVFTDEQNRQLYENLAQYIAKKKKSLSRRISEDSIVEIFARLFGTKRKARELNGNTGCDGTQDASFFFPDERVNIGKPRRFWSKLSKDVLYYLYCGDPQIAVRFMKAKRENSRERI